jgi:hypothetical protein
MAKEKKTKKKKKRASAVEEPKPVYLTKQILIRAINKGSRHLAAEALEIMGYNVVEKDGWIVKIDKNGDVIEKISKIKKIKRPRKIFLD